MGKPKHKKFKKFIVEDYDDYADERVIKEQARSRRKERKMKRALKNNDINSLMEMQYEDDF